MNLMEYFQMLPAKVAEMEQTIAALRAQLERRAAECAAEQAALQTVKTQYEELHRAHQLDVEARDNALRELGARDSALRELQASNALALKQRDAANSRRDALEKAVEAGKLEQEADRMELEQLRAKLSSFEAQERPTGVQNAAQQREQQVATINPALLQPKADVQNQVGASEGIPARWQAQLTALPTVEAPDEAMTSPFSRKFLSAQLGGGTQGVVMRVAANNTAVRLKEFEITRYYCPKAQGNPWLPKQPGMHGFMFVGMGELDRTVGADERCEMFVGMGMNDWRYFGTYQCTRMEALTVEDYMNLIPADQTKYCKFTVAKNLANNVAEAQCLYLSGTLRVPCVRLACQDFNQPLFDRLCANVQSIQASPPASAKRQRQTPLTTPALPANSAAQSSRRASGRLRVKPSAVYTHDSDLDSSPAKRPRLDGPPGLTIEELFPSV